MPFAAACLIDLFSSTMMRASDELFKHFFFGSTNVDTARCRRLLALVRLRNCFCASLAFETALCNAQFNEGEGKRQVFLRGLMRKLRKRFPFLRNPTRELRTERARRMSDVFPSLTHDYFGAAWKRLNRRQRMERADNG
jgi:hypothetical protein